MKLKPSEVPHWIRVYAGRASYECADSDSCARFADRAIEKLRERFEDPGPRPDAGRL